MYLITGFHHFQALYRLWRHIRFHVSWGAYLNFVDSVVCHSKPTFFGSGLLLSDFLILCHSVCTPTLESFFRVTRVEQNDTLDNSRFLIRPSMKASIVAASLFLLLVNIGNEKSDQNALLSAPIILLSCVLNLFSRLYSIWSVPLFYNMYQNKPILC